MNLLSLQEVESRVGFRSHYLNFKSISLLILLNISLLLTRRGHTEINSDESNSFIFVLVDKMKDLVDKILTVACSTRLRPCRIQ